MMKVIRGAPLRLTTLQGASLLATRRVELNYVPRLILGRALYFKPPIGN